MVSDLHHEVKRLSDLIDAGVKAVTTEARKAAHAEHDYRKGKGEQWTRVKAEGERTAAHMAAEVDARTADLRLHRDLAEGERASALEALRSRRTQLSAVQTLANVDRAEAEIAGKGPR